MTLKSLKMAVAAAMFCLPLMVSGQEIPPEFLPDSSKMVFDMYSLENPPQFPGGETALLEFLKENLQYPDSARIKNIRGVVVANFVVGKDGAISEVGIRKSLDPFCDKEVLRIISRMPAWIPGRIHDKAVNARVMVPVLFKL